MAEKEVDEARKDGPTRRDRKEQVFLPIMSLKDEEMLLNGLGKGSGMVLVFRRV